MKKMIIFLLILCMNEVSAQEWRKFHRNNWGTTYQLVDNDDVVTGRHFRINPYDNSLWMATQSRVQTISSDGSYSLFYVINTPAFQSPFQFATFDFAPGKVFILDLYQGVYLYENDNISMMYSSSGIYNGLTIDEDTLYVLRNNNPMAKLVNGTTQYLFNAGTSKRIIARNNFFWISGGIGIYSGIALYDINGIHSSYTNILMDNGNFDFKFSPHHDTLYVAGNKGLSLLHNFTFFDSIAPDNTTDMPSGVILDFEFDASDNIWALFGTDAQTPTSIAHYDQQSKSWDMYYDAGNSDLNFSSNCSIEMDNLGNLWMVNQNYIHVLELGTLPVWLSSKQPEHQPVITVYPNPTTELFQVDTDVHILEIYLTDQLGKRIKTLDPTQKEFSVAELSSGIYFVELTGEGGTKSTVKLIKN